MPRGKFVRDALRRLQEYEASLAPQSGMFSTLDELIKEAPFEQVPAEQWINYLQPGRSVQRGQSTHTLKKEELKFTELHELIKTLEDRLGSSPTRADVQTALRRHRPTFGLTIQDESSAAPGRRTEALLREFDPEESYGTMGRERDQYGSAGRTSFDEPEYGPGNPYESGDRRLSHQSPGSSYQESITELADLDYHHGQHFGDQALSHHRVSIHPNTPIRRVDLVDELQSDIHRRASKRVDPRTGLEAKDMSFDDLVEGGYITPEELVLINSSDYTVAEKFGVEQAARDRVPRLGYLTKYELDEINNRVMDPGRERYLRMKPPDAPFKNPKDYAALELRKRLFRSAEEGADYLALTRGDDQIQRYSLKGKAADESRKHYDEIYRGELERLAKRYGAEIEDIEFPVSSSRDLRPEVMRRHHLENSDDVFDYFAGRYDLEQMTVGEAGRHIERIHSILSEVDFPDLETQNILQELNRVYTLMAIRHGMTPGLFKSWKKTIYRFSKDLNEYFDALADVQMTTKSFPAIKLTPEIRERILNEGVPLWQLAPGAVIAPMLMEGEQEERAGMAEGGLLRRLRDRYQRGGRAESEHLPEDPSYQRLAEAKQSLADLGPNALHTLDDLRKHFMASVRANWSDFDPETGDLRFFLGGYDPHSGREDVRTETLRPGIVDDMLMLPALSSDIGEAVQTLSPYVAEAFGFQPFTEDVERRPASRLSDDHWSRQAAERIDDRFTRALEEAGLERPRGVLQHLASAAGTMLSQIPTPMAATRKLGPIVGNALEWFSPIVQRKFRPGYTGGTIFGGTLGRGIQAGEDLADSMMEDPPDDFLETYMGSESLKDLERRLRELDERTFIHRTPSTTWKHGGRARRAK